MSYIIIVIYIADYSSEDVKTAIKQILSACTELTLWGVVSTWGSRHVKQVIRAAIRSFNALLISIFLF